MPDDGSAVIRKYRNKLEKLEDDDKSAKENMKSVIAKAMKDEGTHKNIAKELLKARQGGDGSMKNRSCWGDDGDDEFTGIYEDRPWERD
jgi:uncharacterized protein (UPF0335 family)